MNTIAQGTISLRAAREWCTRAHGSQLYENLPYNYHLGKTEAVAVRFGFGRDKVIRLSCWTHDVPEDTKKKLLKLKKYFRICKSCQKRTHAGYCMGDACMACRSDEYDIVF